MSVRMAMAKLCACACGGAIIGGGAVKVAESAPKARPVYAKTYKKHVVRARVASAARSRVRKVVTTTRQ